MNKLYNENENNNSQLIKDLKSLPKIDAPQNFEYNLMARIQNKNFESVKDKKKQFSWVKFLAPSAVVVTVVILFFIFLPSSQQINNPVQKVESQSIVDNSIAVKNEAEKEINLSHDKSSHNSVPLSTQNSTPSNVKSQLPINNSKSIAVDDYISGASGNQRGMQRGNIVSGGEGQNQLNGFFLTDKPDQKTLKKYRAVVDSLKKAQMKEDSLKKSQKAQ